MTPILKETANLIKNTERGLYEKYGQDEIKIQVFCNVEFFDGLTNKIKFVYFRDYQIFY